MKGLLVINGQCKPIEIIGGGINDPVAHHFNAVLRICGNGLACQLFTQKQGQCRLDGHLFFRCRAGDRVCCQPHFLRRAQIAAHSGEIVGTQRLIPHFFHCIITSPRNRLDWRIALMQAGIVMTHFQRIAIGKAARLHRLIRRQIAARHRHTNGIALHARRLCRPSNFGLCLSPDRARGTGQSQFEAIKGGFVSHCSPL